MVATHNLAIGVLVGVLLSGIFFAWKIAQIFRVTSSCRTDGRGSGPIGSRASSSSPRPSSFIAAFDFKEALERVAIDVTHAHIWDISAVARSTWWC